MWVSCKTYPHTLTIYIIDFNLLRSRQMTRKNKSIFKEETLNDLVQYCGSQEELMNTFKTLQKALIEKAMDGELAYHPLPKFFCADVIVS